jgi:hypothetical protein
MLNPGIQIVFSTNWKSAVVVSKFTHSRSDTPKLASETHSAT